MYIGSYENSIIEFHNSTIYNNTATRNGGGIALSGGGSINFCNCTLYKNTAQQYEGGLNIISYNR